VPPFRTRTNNSPSLPGQANSSGTGSEYVNGTNNLNPADTSNPFLGVPEASQLLGVAHDSAPGGGQYAPELARASLLELNEISRRAEGVQFGMDTVHNGGGGGGGNASGAGSSIGISGPTELARITQELAGRPQLGQRSSSGSVQIANQLGQPGQGQGQPQGPGMGMGGGAVAGDEPFIMPSRASMMELEANSAANAAVAAAASGMPPATASHEGLQVYTVGHLLPKGVDPSDSTAWLDPSAVLPFAGTDAAAAAFAAQANAALASAATNEADAGPSALTGMPQAGPSSSDGVSGTLTVRRSSFVPGWAVPPRILLVDDDQVVRTLSKRFLQVFGCNTEVAVDGLAAVEKMNLEQYDLVLMDIIMPKLDGVSATTMIRQFDARTPIISMTSASKPNDLINYFSHGMNDILPKPFSKEGLFDMLEVGTLHTYVANIC
jgi:osomolarity two-component system response regulator SKN7